MYQKSFIQVSHNICVEVKPIYLEKESNPIKYKHVFAYFVTIENRSDQEVKLLHRYWQIKDLGGEDFEVEGEGVIGKQPLIQPNDNHKYNSFCVLTSYRGTMEGYYVMRRREGKKINVRIPQFLLCSHLLN